ncbi:hypothetical protein HCN44_004722 [Aphidius gifuensis]|uniref:Uncharacterized protein n=1 Tax=Aphidius gifuensis TaxID=684658 RepID=A0A834XXC6_APHGI|nr:hypothetical protein HCN44_004722 [Aphidius gifuensis]
MKVDGNMTSGIWQFSMSQKIAVGVDDDDDDSGFTTLPTAMNSTSLQPLKNWFLMPCATAALDTFFGNRQFSKSQMTPIGGNDDD